jgi:RNA recognition motif-containing protein
MSSNLYVGNLPFEVTESELRSLFERAGTVESIRIVTDRYTGRPRGFAFVEMVTEAEAAKAIQLLNGHPMKGRNLVVNEARQEQRRGGGRWRKVA